MNAFQEAEAHLSQYAKDYALGLAAAAISDPIVTSLALGAFAKNKSVRRFFLGYAASRTINTVANAIGVGLTLVAQRQGGVEPVT